jgi:hypothetical protein
LFGRTGPIAVITVDWIVAFPVILLLLVLELLIKLIEHSDENNYDSQPLVPVDVMLEDEDADDDCQYFAGGGNKGKYVLLKVRHDVVNTDLPKNLEHPDTQNSHQSLWMFYHKYYRVLKGTFTHRKDCTDYEPEKVSDSEELVGCRLAN